MSKRYRYAFIARYAQDIKDIKKDIEHKICTQKDTHPHRHRGKGLALEDASFTVYKVIKEY